MIIIISKAASGFDWALQAKAAVSERATFPLWTRALIIIIIIAAIGVKQDHSSSTYDSWEPDRQTKTLGKMSSTSISNSVLCLNVRVWWLHFVPLVLIISEV